MNNDIVTRLKGSADCVCLFHVEHGLTRKCLYCEAADEIERLRKVELKRDMWRNTCIKLVGMMLPFSLLMKPNEQEELTIILKEATFDSHK